MTPAAFVETLWRVRATAILRASDEDTARRAMTAAVAGGFRTIEFTLTTPGVMGLITEFAAMDGLPEVDGLSRPIVGAGTVVTVDQARAAVDAGARFLVSPVADPEVIAEATRLGVASIPGIHTATEMLTAHRAGAPLLKLFPAPAGGPRYLRSVMGPLPFLRVVPTNGVDADNLHDWLAAGAWAAGFVTTLFRPEDLAARRFDAIEARARQILAAARTFDRPKAPRTAPDPFA